MVRKILAALVALPIFAAALTVTDANWKSLGNAYPGADDWANSALHFQGKLILLGPFHVFGDCAVSNIASWDGTSCSSMGGGFTGTPVGMGIDRTTGKLVVAGSFSAIGGITAKYLAAWDGASWTAVAPGLTTVPVAMCLDSNGGIYVASYNSTKMGDDVMRWNGSQWSKIGFANGTIYTMASDKAGNLFIGGTFKTVDSLPIPALARWNGSSWSQLGAGLAGNMFQITFAPNGDLVVAGQSSGGSSLVSRWNGTAWTYPYTFNLMNLSSVCIDSANTVYIGGAAGADSMNVQVWNGTKMVRPAPQSIGTVSRLVCEPGQPLIVVGSGLKPQKGGVGSLGVSILQDGAWHALYKGLNGPVATMAKDKQGNLYVAGEFDTDGDKLLRGIAKFDGTTFTALGAGLHNYAMTLLVDTAGHLIAGGGIDTVDGQVVKNIALWDGSSWSAMGSGFDNRVLRLVNAPDGSVYAAGEFRNSGTVPMRGLAHWTGAAWEAVEGWGIDTLNMSTLTDLCFDPQGNLVVGTNKSKMFRKVGSTWTRLDTLGNVTLMASMVACDTKGNVYMGNSNSLYRWNANGFKTILTVANTTGSGGSGIGDIMVDSQDRLHIGGVFNSVTPKPGSTSKSMNGIAILDGDSLYSTGSGTAYSHFSNYTVQGPSVFVDFGNRIVVGGSFLQAAGMASPFMAEYYLDGTTGRMSSPRQHSVSATTGLRVHDDQLQLILRDGSVRKLNGRVAVVK